MILIICFNDVILILPTLTQLHNIILVDGRMRTEHNSVKLVYANIPFFSFLFIKKLKQTWTDIIFLVLLNCI